MTRSGTVRTRAGTTFFTPGPAQPAADPGPDLRATLRDLRARAEAAAAGRPQEALALDDLDTAASPRLVELLGTGDVGVELSGTPAVRVVESSLPGVWQTWIGEGAGDRRLASVDVAPLPGRLRRALAAETADAAPDTQVSTAASGLLAPLLAEIADWLPAVRRGHPGHSISLSRLPLPPNDTVELSRRLGPGPAVAESRGYGSTRVTATGTRYVWWVQHYNADGDLLVNALEVTAWPSGLAVPWEDLGDSVQGVCDLMELAGP